MTRLLLAVVAGLALGCSPATTRALCDTSEVVLAHASPSSQAGTAIAGALGMLRSMFCPGPAERRGEDAPQALRRPESRALDGPGRPAPVTPAP